MARLKDKCIRFTTPAGDTPERAVVEKWGGEFVKSPDGRMSIRWPVLHVTHTDAIPSDCPCPMAVPVTALDKGVGAPGSGFRIIGRTGATGSVDGRFRYQKIVIVNTALRGGRKEGV